MKNEVIVDALSDRLSTAAAEARTVRVAPAPQLRPAQPLAAPAKAPVGVRPVPREGSSTAGVVSPSLPTLAQLQQADRESYLAYERLRIHRDAFDPASGLRKQYRLEGHDYLQYTNIPDGDCALHGLKISRAQYVAAVNQALRDPRQAALVKTYLRAEAQDSCRNLGEPGCDSFDNRNFLQPQNHQKFVHFVNHRLSQQFYYLESTGNVLPDGTKVPQEEGSLALAGKLFGINIRVWSKRSDQVVKSAENQSIPGRPFVNLLHVPGHYESLLEPTDVANRQHFLNHERAHRAGLGQAFGRSPSVGATSVTRSHAHAHASSATTVSRGLLSSAAFTRVFGSSSQRFGGVRPGAVKAF